MIDLADASNVLALRISREILPHVRTPAQYIGGELNQIVKPGDWRKAELRVVIGFPDAYTIGMSHLGCQILYTLANQTPGVCAERTYAPWFDAEKIMRERGIPLWTWDTRQPVSEADIFALSLQYELCFTTLLNMLDLAGIPLRAADRTDDHPLVIVGGPQADNPEPMAEFLDLVVIGDGEVALASILAAVQEYKAQGIGRRAMIPLLAQRFPWIYAPNLYDVTYHADGTIAGMLPKIAGLPTRIERCKTPNFDRAPFPQKPMVPWVPVVHDRIGIEIMRGCPQVCRFCHAGYTKRPLTYRTVERIIEIAEESYAATGHDEISLLSLSTADYPLLPELAKKLNERFAPRMVNLSFPSLRVDKMLAHIPAMAANVRKSSMTMAVEAARDDMRKAIRKKVTDGNLIEGVRAVYRAGWRKLKLYFMAGFPGERDEDITAIWQLCEELSRERWRMGLGAPAEIVASVGWLVPKPFTPLQWMAQQPASYYQRVRDTLRQISRGEIQVSGSYAGAEDWAEAEKSDEATKRRSDGADSSHAPLDTRPPEAPPRKKKGPKPIVTIRTHDARRSVLEAVLSRGDRRLAPVILEAWRLGARFDGWDDSYNDLRWQQAYAAGGIDPAWYAHRERPFGEVLPWSHIGLHMSREYLERSYDDMYQTIGVAKPAAPTGTALPLLS
ncbi:MAG: TIGR03960 family B12-binding radical SAM protein [Phycisphaerae bacterium]|nr:TIGR03960 family B12-binding radical SAM protein [Phycisphaerae bacterium]